MKTTYDITDRGASLQLSCYIGQRVVARCPEQTGILEHGISSVMAGVSGSVDVASICVAGVSVAAEALAVG